MKNEIKKNITQKCDLCGSKILIDENSLGYCQRCGWANAPIAVARPNKIFLPNFVSYDRAKQLYKNGMVLKPNIDEFLEVLEVKNQISFFSKGKIFEAIKLGEGIELFDIANNYAASFDSMSEFKYYAAIDEIRLIDNWDMIENIDYLR